MKTNDIMISSNNSDNGNSGNTASGLEMFVERFAPCHVCGEPSSGWHCGAITCEACKKFFLRSLNGEDAKYKCLRNKDCVIMRTTRTQCQYCRFKKCKDVGMTTGAPHSPAVVEIFKLIPCKVCTAPSSGFHFGAVTCEGCKGFFRRSTKERAPERYKCLENENCPISAQTRNMCRFCRYKKCMEAGMNPKNSRIGRQSNLFKHNMIEWQSKGGVAGASNKSNGGEYSHALTHRKINRAKAELTMADLRSSTVRSSSITLAEYSNGGVGGGGNGLYNMSNVNGSATPAAVISVNQFTNQTYVINNINTASSTNNNYHNSYYGWPTPNYNPDSTSSPVLSYNSSSNMNNNNNNIQTMQPISSGMHRQMMPPALMHTTTAAAAVVSSGTEDTLPPAVAAMIRMIHRFYEKHLSPEVLKQKSNESLQQMSPLAPHSLPMLTYHNSYDTGYGDYNNGGGYYNSNGSLHEIAEHFNFYAKQIAQFLDDISGKFELENQDKEEMIKSSIHSVVLLSLQRSCKFYNYFNLDKQKLETYLKLFPVFMRSGEFMKNIHEKFRKFELDDKEYSLYTTILIISAANKYLKQFEKISEIRHELGEALRKYMKARRNDETTCDEIMLTLNYFRKFNSVLQRGITSSYLKMLETNMSIKSAYPFIERVFLPNPNEIKFYKQQRIN